MKKIILITLLTFCAINANAQKSTFGILIGVNAIDLESNPTNKYFSAITNDQYGLSYASNFGFFTDVILINKYSLKNEITLTLFKENFIAYPFSMPGATTSYPEIKLALVNISPKLKFNFSESIKKGLYLELGPRYTMIIARENLIYYYNKRNLGVQFGLGINFLKYFSSNINFDYTITNILNKTEPESQRQIAALLNLNIHLDSIFKK